MWDISDLLKIPGLGTLEYAHHNGPFDHGLGRDQERGQFAMYNVRSAIGLNPRHIDFGITQMLPVNLHAPDASNRISNAVEMLHHHVAAWQDRVSYQELGSLWQLPGETNTDTDNTSEGETAAAKSANKRHVMHPHHYGYMRLHSVFSRTFNQLREENPDDDSIKAFEMAERALKEILPQQAYLFISPTELMHASKEAERIAEETLKHAKTREKEQIKESKLYGKVKNRLEHGIRTLRLRHDGRMHIFPFTELSAPETGVATIAIIASQQQSIVNDHGRYSASSRGLVF